MPQTDSESEMLQAFRAYTHRRLFLLRAEKLHIETDVKRVVYIIETKHEKDTSALETVRTLFAVKVRDFIGYH